MPFDREPTRAPTRIARVTVHLAVLEDAAGAVTYDKGTAEIQVVMSDNSSVVKSVADLNAQLTAAQRTTVKGILDAMLAKAKAEVL